MLSESVLHEGQNYLFHDDKISGLRNFLREVCISVDTSRDSVSRFSSEAEEHMQVLQETVVLSLLEIKLLAANDIPLCSSKTTCSISAMCCWELKSKGATLVLDKLRFKAHKKFDGLTGLMEFFLTAMLRLIAGNMGDKWLNSEGTLFQSEGITRKTCKIELAQQVLHLFMKPTGQIKLAFETCLMFCFRYGIKEGQLTRKKNKQKLCISVCNASEQNGAVMSSLLKTLIAMLQQYLSFCLEASYNTLPSHFNLHVGILI